MKYSEKIIKLANKFEIKLAQNYALDDAVEQAMVQWQNQTLNKALNDPTTNPPEGNIAISFNSKVNITKNPFGVNVILTPVKPNDNLSLQWGQKVLTKYGNSLKTTILNAITANKSIIDKYFASNPELTDLPIEVTTNYTA